LTSCFDSSYYCCNSGSFCLNAAATGADEDVVVDDATAVDAVVEVAVAVVDKLYFY
jgi:hypothetical protein